MEGFDRLQQVTTLQIFGNSQLNSISTLNGLSSLSSFTIVNNPILSECDLPAICNILNTAGIGTVFNNSVGCNSTAEIFADCNIGPCQDSLILIDPIISSGVYQASTFISISGTVNANSNVVFSASNIDLDANTNIEIGANIVTYNIGCN